MIFASAPYFIDCISEQDLDEMNIEIIRNTLYKVMNTTSKSNLVSSVSVMKLELMLILQLFFVVDQQMTSTLVQRKLSLIITNVFT